MEAQSLAHKLVVVAEEEGLSEAEYSVRELVSSKQLRVSTTMRDPATGKHQQVEYTVQGPVAMLFSTTSARIHHENATRFLSLNMDESREQTRRIHEAQRRARSVTGIVANRNTVAIARRHRNAQRLLEPLPVVIPDVEEIRFPDRCIRARREHDKFLTVVEAIAFLHQKQRPVKTVEGPAGAGDSPDGPGGSSDGAVRYIEATKADVETAAKLLFDVMEQAMNDVGATSRDLLKRIREMVETRAKDRRVPSREVWFNRRDVREYTNWSDWQIRVHMKDLEEMELIYPVSGGGRGKEYRYELVYDDPTEEAMIMGYAS